MASFFSYLNFEKIYIYKKNKKTNKDYAAYVLNLQIFNIPLEIIIQLNDIPGKTVFTQFSTEIYCNRCLAPSDFLYMFTQSIKFYTFHCHI